MELFLTRQPVTINENLLTTTAEQPVECDVLLPDYCPDLVRILKCTLEPTVSSATVSGDKLLVEGVAVAHVYYKSEERDLCSAEYKMPFNKQIDLKSTPQSPTVTVRAEAGYCNCRVVNQRRLDLRGAVTLQCKVTSTREEQMVGSAQGMGVQSRHRQVDSTKMLTQANKPFTMREEMDLPSDKGAINTPIRVDAMPSQVESRVISGKVIAKAEVTINMLYLCEDNREETAQLTLPVSQIIDVDGIDEDCLCAVNFGVGSCEITPKPDLDGEAHSVTVELGMNASISACRPEQVQGVSDSYCTKYECRTQTRPMTTQKPLPPVEERFDVKESMPLPDGVNRVNHLWCSLSGCETVLEGQSMVMKGKIVVCMFACGEDGSNEYFDKTVDFEHKVETGESCEKLEADLSFNLCACNYSVSGGQLELRCSICATGLAFCTVRCQMVTDIAVDEQKPVSRENSSCLTVYFSEPGESVWDIAKRYNTAPNLVAEENSLGEDEAPGVCMLLIPII